MAVGNIARAPSQQYGEKKSYAEEEQCHGARGQRGAQAPLSPPTVPRQGTLTAERLFGVKHRIHDDAQALQHHRGRCCAAPEHAVLDVRWAFQA